ncbi:response regulator [Paracidovorax citrulli]|uniref:response regulator n=1 Tax=Paracidovorax citrulli TaxID=80869 RepID=UPI0006627A72|nr:response regulator [Paracidovorax citrulli]QCX12883.1 hypothetical protein APS58_4181 [Paracidovorax citrulli]UEG47943.1 response regulator [Paracidovorax citrulli]UMT96798.1 response regulator [Paracidovorax citrulli]
MSRPVVLLVEDDPSVARFVSMALEILPVAVETCPCVESALAWLRHHRAALVITDLMLPGESGMALLRQLQAEPALAAGARIVVLSAGLDHAVRQELAACGAWRALDKPVGVAALERCVQEALADVPLSSGEAGAAAAAGAPHSPDVAGSAAATAESTAIQEYFSGDAALFHAYRAACLAQFGRDAAEGDRALRSRDLAALRRLCHSLSSVLRTLGRTEDGALAREAELAARDGRHEAARDLWLALSRRLDR